MRPWPTAALAVFVLASAALAQEPKAPTPERSKALAELLERIPADAPVAVILPAGKASKERLDAAAKRLLLLPMKGEPAGDAPHATVALPPTAEGGEPVVLTLPPPGAAAGSPAEAWLKRPDVPRLSKSFDGRRLDSAASADLVLRVHGVFEKPDLAAKLLRAAGLPLDAAATDAVVDLLGSSANEKPQTATVLVFPGEAGLRIEADLEFAEGGVTARYFSKFPKPGGDPFAGLATGEPALLAAADLLPEASRDSAVVIAERAAARLRDFDPELPADYGAKLTAAAGKLAASVDRVAVSVGLPSPGPGGGPPVGVVGMQGLLHVPEGADFNAAAEELAPLVDRALKAVGRKLAVPIAFKRTAAAAKVAGRDADAYSLFLEGESAVAKFGNGILQNLLGPDGLKVLAVSLDGRRVAFGLAGGVSLLERTVGGTGGLPEKSLAVKRLAALPAERHVTLLVSPGRLMFLGRRVQQNALNLPEWKPTGFLAASALFDGRTARITADLPWDEAEAIAGRLAPKAEGAAPGK
jgi:hypothetical protein